MGKLLELLRVHVDDGCVLVFVDTQEACDAMFRDLLKAGLPAQTLHGGMSQDDRDSTISDFKSGATPVLVATSVAARGLAWRRGAPCAPFASTSKPSRRRSSIWPRSPSRAALCSSVSGGIAGAP